MMNTDDPLLKIFRTALEQRCLDEFAHLVMAVNRPDDKAEQISLLYRATNVQKASNTSKCDDCECVPR
jgi:hypothetical protein